MAGTLSRPPRRRGGMLAGVCAALADRFGIGVTVVRLLFILFGVVGAGELAYIVLWVVIPKDERP